MLSALLSGMAGTSPAMTEYDEMMLGKRAVTADTDLRLARYVGNIGGLLPRSGRRTTS